MHGNESWYVRTFSQLSEKERETIGHRYLVGHESAESIAKEFSVPKHVVYGNFQRTHQKNPRPRKNGGPTTSLPSPSAHPSSVLVISGITINLDLGDGIHLTRTEITEKSITLHVRTS